MADYCTAAELKTRLDISGSTYDTQLAALVTAASRWIDQHCRVPVDGFAATAAAKRYFGLAWIDGSVLALDAPLLSVTTLKNGDGSTIAAGSWWLRPRNNVGWYIELKSDYSWTFDTDTEIEVEGVWGVAATVPAPVKEAALVFAGWMFKRYQAALSDATVNFDLGELTYSQAVPKQVIALLAPYQLLVGAL
jgi:hypothetical protein